MNSSPFISIIIPVYNVQEYLQACIDSACGQSVFEIEIILVNDGSTDASGDICEKAAQKDSRIRVVNKTNGGEINARKAGVEIAQGEWIYFLDSDDTIQKDTLEKMLQYTSKDVDIVVFESPMDCIYTEQEYAKAILRFKHWSNWGKLYRRSSFTSNTFTAPRYFKVGGDFLTTLHTLENLKGKVVCKPIYCYNYNRHAGSALMEHRPNYEYELRMIEETERIVTALPWYKDIEPAHFSWKIKYLSGMMGLGYDIPVDDKWIIDLQSQAKRMPTSLRSQLAFKALHHPYLRCVFVADKRLRRLAKKGLMALRGKEKI